MRIAFFATCPADTYSGGRYHALIAAYCLARLGHSVWFITDNTPVFDQDLRILSPDNPVRIVVAADFEVESAATFDAVFVAPQANPRRRLYTAAVAFARHHAAALVLICYETPNWFNALAPVPRPETAWDEWHVLAAAGALVLCSAEESRRHAADYFVDVPPETVFDVWQPAINGAARDAAVGDGTRRRIVLFARPSDAHKGGDALQRILTPALAGHVFTIVIGKRRNSEDFVARIEELARARGLTVEVRYTLTDVEKFALLTSAAVLVFPSHFEGYGYPPVEALACDTPCVAYDLPVLRETCGDRLTYVPVGDLDALRDAVVDVVRAGPPAATATDPAIAFLTDVDVRAAELERILTEYLAHRHRVRPFTAGQRLALAASPASLVEVCGETLLTLVLSSRKPISAVVGDERLFDCAAVTQLSWRNGAWQHLVTMRVRPDRPATAATPGPLTFMASFYNGAKAAFRLDVDLDRTAGDVIAAGPTMVNLTDRRSAAGRLSVGGWALPTVAYDGAVWIARTADGLAARVGTTGLPTQAYRTVNRVPERIDGGLQFRLPADHAAAERHAILLTRNGQPVAIAEIAGERLEQAVPVPGIDLVAGVAHDEPYLPIGDVAAPKLFRSTADVAGDGIDVALWTNLHGAPSEIEVRLLRAGAAGAGTGEETLLATVPLNAYRDDVRKNYGFPTDDLGFSVFLPRPADATALHAVTLRSGGVALDRIPRLVLRTVPALDLPLTDCAPLRGDLVDGVRQAFTAPVAARPALSRDRPLPDRLQAGWTVTHALYDALDGVLLVFGTLGAAGGEVELVDAVTGTILAPMLPAGEREAVAAALGLPADRPGAYCCRLPARSGRLPPLAVRLVTAEGAAERPLGPIEAIRLREFKVLDQSHDRDWRLIWIRGSFVQAELSLATIELRQNGVAIAEGIANAKQLRHGEPLSGWRFEAIAPDGFDFDAPVEIVGTTTTGLVCRLRTPLANPAVEVPRRHAVQGLIARHGPERAADLLLPDCRPTDRPAVLLVVHNLDAVDRPEKVRALESLSRALDARGLRLVILHHSRNPIPAPLAEINFFDDGLDLLSATAARLADPPLIALRDRLAMADALYGFLASINVAVPAIAACEAQIDEEIRKVDYVIGRLAPQAVLLWHQWNSLSAVAARLAGARSLPVGYLHEGMLPKSLTFDRAMMAESAAVGVRLDAADPASAPWLERADAALAAIRDGRLDRKPVSPLAIAAAVRRMADARGARLVFYAGINDWHSGNLPRDDAALAHSPVYEDSHDGLAALAALAEANDWVILYKPHPNLYPRLPDLGPRVVAARESNPIDCLLAADATVTILSSLSYVARANGKPVVQLGRNTLSGTGAVFEPADRAGLEAAVRAALADADRPARDAAFRAHVAALLRDHLYVYEPDDSLALLGHDRLADRIRAFAAAGWAADATGASEVIALREAD